jgi:hypothetical protein
LNVGPSAICLAGLTQPDADLMPPYITRYCARDGRKVVNDHNARWPTAKRFA